MIKNSQYITLTIQGTERQDNLDRIQIINTNLFDLYILYDGVSSSLHIKNGFLKIKEYIDGHFKHYIGSNNIDINGLIFSLNHYIVTSKEDLGTSTISIIYVDKNCIYGANLGDTRVYGIGQQFLKQYSEDHHLKENKNILTKYLGMADLEKTDITVWSMECITGDRVLICTDGFYNLFESSKTLLHKTLRKYKDLNWLRKKLEKMVIGKNYDDASLIILNLN